MSLVRRLGVVLSCASRPHGAWTAPRFDPRRRASTDTFDALASPSSRCCAPNNARSNAVMIVNEPAKELVLPTKEVVDAMLDQRNEATQKASKSCADWNALLCWAREERGPQFDSSTALYMVDKASYEGTAYVEPVPCVTWRSMRLTGAGRPTISSSRAIYPSDRRVPSSPTIHAFCAATPTLAPSAQTRTRRRHVRPHAQEGLADRADVPRPTRSRARYN